ncbi:MAG: rhodanese-like domain-containing protein, partial [Cyanobacteria bacterium]|nr:rhodanese-like domain-containing protein [Cyanobacteriota bacterium]
VEQLSLELQAGTRLKVLDVRRPGEYAEGHVPGALNIPLAELRERTEELQDFQALAVICASGYRSMIACSLLEGCGIATSINITGGTKRWKEAGFTIESTVPLPV